MKTLVIISAGAEWRAVKEIVPDVQVQPTPMGEYFDLQLVGDKSVRFFHGGWGKVSAAATAQYGIDHFSPELLVNLGTCGGFAGRIEKGAIILVERTIVYDIIEQMGDSALPPSCLAWIARLGRPRYRRAGNSPTCRALRCRRRGLGIGGHCLGGSQEQCALVGPAWCE